MADLPRRPAEWPPVDDDLVELIGLLAEEAEERVRLMGLQVKIETGRMWSAERGIDRVRLAVADGKIVYACKG